MYTKILHQILPTNDPIIRLSLKERLKEQYAHVKEARIIEEFGVHHGSVRIDVALINGMMHGYEIKSDRDTLERLPEQMNEYNSVFDRVSLVVGKKHLYRAIHIVPDWWGITMAKIKAGSEVVFQTIREPEDNKGLNKVSIARLLWREEALQILEECDKADGVRSKSREFIYQRLADELETDALKEKVQKVLLVPRKDWRFGPTLISYDG